MLKACARSASQKKHRTQGVSWAKFYTQRIGMTLRATDQFMHRLEEFAPAVYRAGADNLELSAGSQRASDVV
jgi:hypothetical protein